MIDTSHKINLNDFTIKRQTNEPIIPLRMIAPILLILFLMIPTNGRGLPPYFLITMVSIPFILRGLYLSPKKENAFLIYYAFAYISSLFIHFYSGSFILAVSFISYFVLSPMIIKRTIKTRKNFDFIISIIVVLFSIYSVLGIFEATIGVNIFDRVFGRTESVLWAGIGYTRYGFNLSYGFLRVMHNNATLMCMIWAIAAYQLCNAKKHKTIWFLCWFIIGTYDILMMSRMVIFTAPILQILIFKKLGMKWLSKRVMVFFAIMLLVVCFSSSDLFLSIFNTLGGLFAPIIDEIFDTSMISTFDSSLGGSGHRFILWSWIFDAVKGKMLFGRGFTDVWSTTISGKNYLGQIWYSEKTSIEVQWLYTLYRTGIFGLSGFVVFQVGSLRKMWKTKVACFEEKVSFQYVMKWLSVFYFVHLFGIAAAEELYFFYLLFALYMCYIRICNMSAFSMDN